MREVGNNGRGGILEPVWKALDTAVAAAQNRLELFRVEVQEEKVRVMELALLASAIIVLGTLALTVGTVAVVMVVWNDGGLIALACLASGYAIGAFAAWRALKARLKSEPPFAGTSEELRKDRECIRP
jgi:uncharacterized membrane protein YqjE